MSLPHALQRFVVFPRFKNGLAESCTSAAVIVPSSKISSAALEISESLPLACGTFAWCTDWKLSLRGWAELFIGFSESSSSQGISSGANWNWDAAMETLCPFGPNKPRFVTDHVSFGECPNQLTWRRQRRKRKSCQRRITITTPRSSSEIHSCSKQMNQKRYFPSLVRQQEARCEKAKHPQSLR